MSKERYHLGLAEALARACEAVTNADSTQPILAPPGGLAVGRAEACGLPDLARLQAAVDRLAFRDLGAEAEAAFAATPFAAWLRQARAVMDLLASPEPPEGFAAQIGPAFAWAWLRRQAGLEGEGK